MMLPFEKFDREVKVKYDASSVRVNKFNELSVEELLSCGIVVLDKPSGPTSHMAVDYLKKVLGISKAGHSGTLDPGVTGVLPVALGKSTRVTHSLLTAGKEYVCLMHMHKNHGVDEVLKLFEEYTGVITQLPPKKSAVKRQNRKREIYYLKLLDKVDQDVLFLVGCQAGTYIRKLVHDMGLSLGSGAHMAELRRTKAGPFLESDAVTLQDLADALHYYKVDGDDSLIRSYVKPLEMGVSHLRKVWVNDEAVKTLSQGASLKLPGVVKFESGFKVNDLVAVMSLADELVMVGNINMSEKDLDVAKRGVVVYPSQVFLKPEDV